MVYKIKIYNNVQICFEHWVDYMHELNSCLATESFRTSYSLISARSIFESVGSGPSLDLLMPTLLDLRLNEDLGVG